MSALDNPIWSALTTRQAHLAEHASGASRFQPDVSILAGFVDFGALTDLVPRGERAGVFMDEPAATPGFEIAASAPLLQMIHDGGTVPDEDDAAIVLLGETDLPAMMALAELTKPGPFNRRTPELGDFAGIFERDTLVAMAGQRLRVPGHVELSAICTHPDHVGRGHGAALTRWQLRRLQRAGEHPILHVRGDNDRAIALYERLGFAPRLRSRYVILQRA